MRSPIGGLGKQFFAFSPSVINKSIFCSNSEFILGQGGGATWGAAGGSEPGQHAQLASIQSEPTAAA